MPVVCHLDYEFRSGVDINDVGSHRASIDPEFEILMAAVSGEGVDDPVFLWVNPKFRTPDMMGQNREAEELLNSADIVFAHNAPNEQANTWGAFAQGKACPFWKEPPLTIWRCTAAMSRKAGLPNALGDVADFLGTPVKKDKRGKDLIKLFTQKNEIKPTKEAKKAGALPVVRFIEPLERQDEFIAFGSYCCDDVRAEKHVHKRLKPFELSGAQLDMFQFDLRMNQRGIPINVDGARRAQRLINRVQSVVIREFRDLTGLNPTQRQKTQEWLFEHGCPLENMQATTVEEAIERQKGKVAEAELLGDEKALVKVRQSLRVIELYQKVSYSAVAKIQTMLECVCPDGRVRGGHMFYGAGTGRWSGKLIQPQNYKRTPPELKDITDAVYKAICDGWTPEMIDQIYGDPLEMLSICIRHFIFHPQYRMLDGDYNAVEARIICWLAGETEALEEYRLGVDRYQIMATEIYQRSLEYIKSLGKDSTERQVGKQAVLGAGFGLGRPEKFKDTVKKQGGIDISLELAEAAIQAFRRKHKKIVAYWWQLDDLCKKAVKTPGVQFGPFVVKTIAGIPFLLFHLRSGRALAYPRPKIELFPWTPKKRKPNAEDDGYDDGFAPETPNVVMRENVVYWGEIKPRVWGWIKLYGGKLAENETQATAADFMGAGAIEAERQGMEPFMLVHDQGLALITDPERHTVEAYERALGTLPLWAKGMPLKVEGKICRYYRK